MKVVLFCGGFGLRMRSKPESVPKPMVQIGYRPILWHIMKYYAHFGHTDFILCLGWKGDVIKEYFLNYDECLSNDFVLSQGGASISLLNQDIASWNITFVDTGTTSTIGERLRRVGDMLRDEEAFLANYTDGLTDCHLPDMIQAFQWKRPAAMFLSVRPRHSFHTVNADDSGRVEIIRPIETTGVWMNGGFFIMTPEIFDYLDEDEELVDDPFSRLIREGKLYTYRYDGFWSCMDTYKEKQELDDMYEQGTAVWEVWKNGGATSRGSSVATRALRGAL